ncbi:MAG: hypothetical protein V9G20_12675 [Candidatus Promineifilaceae bacterium]
MTFAPLVVIAGIVGVIIAYVKRGEARGTWVASHFDWLIATFWWSLLWDLIALVIGILTFWILGLGILLGILILAATSDLGDLPRRARLPRVQGQPAAAGLRPVVRLPRRCRKIWQ